MENIGLVVRPGEGVLGAVVTRPGQAEPWMPWIMDLIGKTGLQEVPGPRHTTLEWIDIVGIKGMETSALAPRPFVPPGWEDSMWRRFVVSAPGHCTHSCYLLYLSDIGGPGPAWALGQPIFQLQRQRGGHPSVVPKYTNDHLKSIISLPPEGMTLHKGAPPST